jgi:hypothetical protein
MKIHFVFCYNISWYAFLSPIFSRLEGLVRISHFAIILENEFGKKTVYESVFPRTRKIDFDEWKKKYEMRKLFTFGGPREKQFEVFEWLEAQKGKHYPFSQLFFILFAMINKCFENISFGWVLNGSQWLICTELGSRFIDKFFVTDVKESHDRIGLRDMLNLSQELEVKKEIWG